MIVRIRRDTAPVSSLPQEWHRIFSLQQRHRLLVARLDELGPDWNYPIHLGVTEAGEGEDGRIKSAIGIGSLLCDGLGDTIRVSLTEDSPHEIGQALQSFVRDVRKGSA